MASKLLQLFDGYYYMFDGVPMNKHVTDEERSKSIQAFSDIRDDDVLVWGFLKSGNHMVHDIVRKLQYDGNIELAVKESVDAFLEVRMPEPFIYNHAVKTPLTLDDISEMPSPRVLATHLHHGRQPAQVQAGKCKVIYIIRNPKDIAVSYYHMYEAFCKTVGLEIVTWNDFFTAFIDGDVFWGSWFAHVKDWYAVKGLPHILLVKYEDLLQDITGQTKRISAFIGKNLSDDVIEKVAESCTFKSAKKQFPTSQYIRKGTSGGWKAYFTVAQREEFDQKMQQELEGTGIAFSE